MKDLEECVECKNLAERLTKRMALEGKILDKISIIPKGDRPWFLIPKKWHQTWKSFVLAKKVVPEQVLVPGPVDTSSLLDAAGVPRKGLIPLKDYRVITQVLWEALEFLYGCGTPIRREKVDIYEKEPVLGEDEHRILTEEQVKELTDIKEIDIRQI